MLAVYSTLRFHGLWGRQASSREMLLLAEGHLGQGRQVVGDSQGFERLDGMVLE